MEKSVKNYLLGLYATNHCKSMSEAAGCSSCGAKYQKARREHERLRREKPELFERKAPEFKPSRETKNMFGMLVDRIMKDKLYKRHVERLAHGTEEEKSEEIKKSNKGYYRTHYEKDGNILIARQ